MAMIIQLNLIRSSLLFIRSFIHLFADLTANRPITVRALIQKLHRTKIKHKTLIAISAIQIRKNF